MGLIASRSGPRTPATAAGGQAGEIVLAANDAAGDVKLTRDEWLREFGFGG